MIVTKGPIQYRCGKIAVLLVLTPMMLLNASQAMTLCVGHDGHVAVEIVVQDRCTCEAPTSGADGVLADAASRLWDGRSLSCTDISTPVGSCVVRPAPATLKAISADLAAASSLPSSTATGAIDIVSWGSPPGSISYYQPLNSVILRV